MVKLLLGYACTIYKLLPEGFIYWFFLRNFILCSIYRMQEIIDQYYEQRRTIILINASGIVKEDTTAESHISATSSFSWFTIPRVDGQVWQVTT